MSVINIEMTYSEDPKNLEIPESSLCIFRCKELNIEFFLWRCNSQEKFEALQDRWKRGIPSEDFDLLMRRAIFSCHIEWNNERWAAHNEVTEEILGRVHMEIDKKALERLNPLLVLFDALEEKKYKIKWSTLPWGKWAIKLITGE